MQRFVALLFTLGLTGCGMELVPQMDAPPQAMMFDKFDTRLVISGDHEWTVGVTARSFLGKTFFNNNITVNNGRTGFSSLIKLGREGGLFVADPASAFLFRVGSFDPKTTRLEDDAPITVRLDRGVTFDVVWADYIPMGGNVIELKHTLPLTPCPLRPTLLRP